MHSVKTGKLASRIGKAVFGTLLLVGISGAAMAQNMVVRSTGPSAKAYPAGKKLASNATISLKKLDRVTILGRSGTRVLRGPGTFSLNRRASATTSTTRLASFISNRGSSRPRTGAVRTVNAPTVIEAPKNPNLWFLDVTKGGKFCVANPKTLVLWRPDFTGNATASIVAPTSGTITEVAWRKGSSLKRWPTAEAPLNNGARYQVIGSNVPKSVEVNFVMLSSAPRNLDEAAAALIENDCQSQLDLLVQTLDDGSSAESDQG